MGEPLYTYDDFYTGGANFTEIFLFVSVALLLTVTAIHFYNLRSRKKLGAVTLTGTAGTAMSALGAMLLAVPLAFGDAPKLTVPEGLIGQMSLEEARTFLEEDFFRLPNNDVLIQIEREIFLIENVGAEDEEESSARS